MSKQITGELAKEVLQEVSRLPQQGKLQGH